MIPVFGLFIGSFANVLIWRIPRKEEWISTPSHCPKCGRRLTYLDMVPVLSWLFLRGRCRACAAPISARYPLVELLNALLWLICARVFGPVWFLPVALAVSTALLVIAFIDWDTKEIPDGLQIFILVIGILWNIYAFFAGEGLLLRNIIGFFSVSVLFLLIAILSKGGMGGGDIKLTAVCGLILGWQNMLLALGIASVLGMLVMLPSMIKRKRTGKSQIPFGPFLAIGIFIALCFGQRLILIYLNLFMP
jgi:leader peptidase (prepilin peptidase)/N-methyltransferase